MTVAMVAALACSADETTTPAYTSAPAAPEAPQAPAEAAPAAAALPAAKAAAATSAAALPARPIPTEAPAALIQRGGRMILGTYQEIETLDPHQAGLRNNKNAHDGLYGTMTVWDPEGSGLAVGDHVKSWEVQDGGLTWIFTIHDNIEWHNGRKFTADDVKYTMDRVFDPELGSGSGRKVKQIENLEVINPTTIKASLSSLNGALLGGFIDLRLVAKENVDGDSFSKGPIGTGPFKFQEYVVFDRVVMDKHTKYHDTGKDGSLLPYLDGVTVQTLPDPTALYTALITGLVDTYWQMTPKFMVQLETLPDAKAIVDDSRLKTAFNNFFWEWDRGIFQDVRARKAILMSLDREASVFAGYEGLAGTNPTNSFFPPGGPFTNPDLKNIDRDVAAATALWAEIFAEYGEQKITFLYTAISAEFRPMSLVHKQNMADVGVTNLEIKLISIQDFLDELALGGRTPTWRTDNAMAPNISFRTTEPADTLTSWQCGRHWSSHYCDEQLDGFITEGLGGTDFAARQDAYYKYQVRAQEIIPSYVCCWRAVGHGVGKRLQGLISHFGDFNYDRAWIKQ